MRLNGEALVENSVTPSTVREGRTLQVTVGDLLLNDLNPKVVTRTDGTGVLYSTAPLDLRLLLQMWQYQQQPVVASR